MANLSTVRGIADEGDEATVNLNTAKIWAQDHPAGAGK
jgi:hypothetical protein